jgi:hypothetical protein
VEALQGPRRLLKLDRQDDAESVGEGIGSTLAEDLRSMSNEELARELNAYRRGVDDAATTNGHR